MYLLDGLDHEVEPLLVGEDVGREAALVAHVASVLAKTMQDAVHCVMHCVMHDAMHCVMHVAMHDAMHCAMHDAIHHAMHVVLHDAVHDAMHCTWPYFFLMTDFRLW